MGSWAGVGESFPGVVTCQLRLHWHKGASPCKRPKERPFLVEETASAEVLGQERVCCVKEQQFPVWLEHRGRLEGGQG